MKQKFRCVLLIIACCIALCGCHQRTIRGEVTEVTSHGFVMEQDGGEPVTVTTGGNTIMFSWFDEISVSDLKEGTMEGIVVSVSGTMGRDGMAASEVQIEGLHIKNFCALEDGTQVDLFKTSLYQMYLLADGTELLFVRKPTDVAEVYIQGIGGLNSLPEEAQQNIKAYYDAQGLLYDEFAALEEAYDEYLTGEGFQTRSLDQEIVPSACNDDVIYFLTIANLPKTELRLCASFDIETGEQIPMEDIFNCKPEEIIARLAEIGKIDDSALIADMEAAFQPEYVTVSQNYLEVNFPAGSLSAYDTAFGMGFEYSDEIRDLLHPWAVPGGGTE